MAISELTTQADGNGKTLARYDEFDRLTIHFRLWPRAADLCDAAMSSAI
jgi:hypothetical protein